MPTSDPSALIHPSHHPSPPSAIHHPPSRLGTTRPCPPCQPASQLAAYSKVLVGAPGRCAHRSWRSATLPLYVPSLACFCRCWAPRAGELQRTTQLNFCILHLHHPSPRPQGSERPPSPGPVFCSISLNLSRRLPLSRTHTLSHHHTHLLPTAHHHHRHATDRFGPGSEHHAAARRRRRRHPRGREGIRKAKRSTRLATHRARNFCLHRPSRCRCIGPAPAANKNTAIKPPLVGSEPPPHLSHPLHRPTTRTGVIPRPLFHHLPPHVPPSTAPGTR